MGNKYEITLKDINQEIELLLTKLNLLIEACNNSNNIDDFFPELLAQIEKYKIDIFNYKRQDLPFVEDMNNGNPISYAGKKNKEAEKNSKLVQACVAKAIDAIYAIRNCDICTEKDKKTKELYWLIHSLRFTLPFKIYALSTLDSYLPYSLGHRRNRSIKKWQAKHAYKNLKKDNWKYIGYAQNFAEAYHYAENNGYTWGDVIHLCAEPEDEYTNSFVKIETPFFTDYFDSYAKGPFGHVFNYRKTKTTCLFCKKIFTYKGHSCEPIINRSNDIYFQYAKCCKGCYKKYVKPAKKDEVFAKKIRTDFKLDI